MATRSLRFQFFYFRPKLELFKPIQHPCSKALGCRSVVQGKAAKVSLGVPVVITIVPEVGKEIFEEPVKELFGVSPTRPAYLASSNALRLVSLKLSTGFMFGNAFRRRIVTEVHIRMPINCADLSAHVLSERRVKPENRITNG